MGNGTILRPHNPTPITQHLAPDTLSRWQPSRSPRARSSYCSTGPATAAWRSEEHTSELQSQSNLVCRLLLEKHNPQRQVCQSPDHHPAPERIRHGPEDSHLALVALDAVFPTDADADGHLVDATHELGCPQLH